MKEYLNFEDGEVNIDNNGDFVDEERTFEDETNELPIIEPTNDDTTNNPIEEDYDEAYLNIFNSSEKKFLDGDYTYKEENTRESKPKKKKNKKVKSSKVSFSEFISYALNILLHIFRFLFALSIVFLLYSLVIYMDLKNDEAQIEMTKEEKTASQIEEVVSNANIDVDSNNGNYDDFKRNVQEYSNYLTEIVNGEILIINNYEKGLIDKKDVYNYFSKTLTKKQEMIKDLDSQVFPEELETITSSLRLISTKAENNSKTIMNDYLVDNSKETIINDMKKFYSTYLTDLGTLNGYLDLLK